MSIAAALGTRIRYYRNCRNLSQEKMAELCQLHPSYVGQIERGEKNITVEVLHQISVGLGVPMAELLQDIDLPESAQDPMLADCIYKLSLLSKRDLKLVKTVLDDVLNLIS